MSQQSGSAIIQDPPTLDEWRELFDVAIRVKELAPWQWMEEGTVFGVQNPETGELGFVSVMGALGEYYAVALYLGPTGLYRFWDMHGDESLPSEVVLETPHLQASFQDRDLLRERDRAIIKSLGLKFRGRKAWPLFRSFRLGFEPWFLEAAEARFLTRALEQLLDMAVRFREDPSILEPPDLESYLVRVPHETGGTLVWDDRMLHVPPPEPVPIELKMNIPALEALSRLPPGGIVIETDFFLFPVSFHEVRGGRPVYFYKLLIVEAQFGFTLGSDLLEPQPSLEAMWGSIPARFVTILSRLGIRPGEVRVRSELLEEVLRPVAQALGFRLWQSTTLPALDEVKQFFEDRFR